jgi:6-phosphogluconate dehydrogenase
MNIGMIGLGKMGANMTTRLIRDRHNVIAIDLNDDAIRVAEGEGAAGARSLDELVSMLSPPHSVWVMVAAGESTENTIKAMGKLLSPGDVVIDGGNSYYKDSQRHSDALTKL